jgi:hypothetical protein
MKNKRGGILEDNLIPYIIAIAVLVLIVVIFVVLRAKGIDALNYLKNLFRFG